MKQYSYYLFIMLLLFFTSSSLASTLLSNEIVGLSGAPLANVQLLLHEKQGLLPPSPKQADINIFVQQAMTAIKQAIQPYGYFKPLIKSTLTYQHHHWIAVYHVQPGPALRIHSLDLSITGAGQHDPVFIQLIHHFPIKQGQIFNSADYVAAKQALISLAGERGYFAATMLQSNVDINLKTYQANIIIHFNTGPRYRFGMVSFSPTPLNHKLLYRFLTFKPGQPFSTKDLQTLQQNLTASRYFTQVIVQPKLKHAKHKRVPIHIHLKTGKSKQYVIGAGFGTDTGIRGLLGVNFNRVNQYGHQFNATLKGSMIQNSLIANYTIPGPNPATDQYRLSAGVLYEDSNAGNSLTQKFSGSMLRKLFGWQQTISLAFQRERSDLDGESAIHTFLIIPSINWLKSVSDNPLRPMHGMRINLNLQGTSKQIGSTVSYFQARLDAKFIRHPTRYTRLILRGTVGYTGINHLTDLPLSQQFFAGGAQSVRGYGYKSIGPGRYLTTVSAELQHKIYGNFYLGGFIDAGDVSNHFASKLKKGVGVDLTWLSPLGAIQISAAKALDEPGQPWKIQFSMGPEL